MVITAAAAMLLCLWTGNALAETKIAIVDLEKTVFESGQGKAAKERLGKRADKMQSDLQKKKEGLEKLDADLKKQESVLSAEALRDKKRELERGQRDLAQQARDYQEELTEAQNTAFSPILKEVRAIIEKMAAEKGYTLVMQAGPGVVYSAPGMDITDEVIKAYDASSKGGKK
jgi:outer membrane protein